MKRLSFPLRIFLLALVLRLAPVIALRTMGIGLDDMFQYDMLARSIVAGNGYRWYAESDLPLVLPYIQLDLTSVEYDPRGVLTAFRPPLYPAFLALVYFVFGVGEGRFFAARLVQTALAASMAPLTYAVGRRLFGREQVGVIAAWVVALYPMFVIYPLSLATENLFFVLVLSSVLALLKAKESLAQTDAPFWRKARWFALSGLFLGLTALTRSVAQIFVLLAVVWVWFFLQEKRLALVTFGMAVVVILPWIVRNSMLYGKLTGIELALGYDLYLGYHPEGTGTFQYPQSLDLMTMMNDAERDKIGIAKALEFIRADPGRVVYLFFRRAGYFFGLERRALTYFYSNNFFGHLPAAVVGGVLALFCLPFMVVSTSATLGLALLRWRDRPETWLLAFLLVGYIAPHLVIIAEDRFHLTTVPFLAMLAAFFWTSGWSALRARWNESKAGRIIVLVSLTFVLLLVANWGWELWRDWDILVQLLGPNGNTLYLSY